MRVLVAEDDPSVAAALSGALTKAGYSCTRVARGADVLERHREFELLMLDLGLEDMDGIDVLRSLREHSDLPVIVVTARDDERSTVQALRLGADDYLVKPLRLHELLARISAVTRRYAREVSKQLVVGELRIDPEAQLVSVRGEEVKLTPTEFALVAELARKVGSAVSREHLVARVWGDDYPAESRTFDVHLAQIRNKLPMLRIVTIRGFGFRLEASGSEASGAARPEPSA
ncbi:response regulator transcription factor [Leucobacter viscericola]|uniref:Response regulator transcription factor n=1 Tax=Leucobacter viscericola TaxID=2714935 RepID=A0A6G7XGR4_9MICO|nr:response regulator transcription factor [Leucobacter viscericola]QIK63587.1 response regulator transcription factor [Leucobacter viscericola]